MIRDRNIVCVASSWFESPTSKHHVMRTLSECNNVLWVNFHASRRPTLSSRDAGLVFRRLRQAWSGARRVSPTMEVLSPLLIPLPESRVARKVNARVLARQIKGALRRLPKQPTQLWLFAPDVPELIALLPTERVVYYCVDDFAAFKGYNTRLIEELESRTIDASDVVIATSKVLYEACAARHPNTHFVPHGVDFDHFAKATRMSRDDVPADVRRLRRPVLGYFGLLGDYVDMELIGRAARRKPEWSFVFIGEVRRDVSMLRGMENVHLLGRRTYESLPAYCRGFDVGLIPFRMNRLTRAVNPIKLPEYLAAGLPVVSAPMHAVERFAPQVRTARTTDEFVEACASALQSGGEEAHRTCQDLVRSESWRARVETLSQIVGKGVEQPGTARPFTFG